MARFSRLLVAVAGFAAAGTALGQSDAAASSSCECKAEAAKVRELQAALAAAKAELAKAQAPPASNLAADTMHKSVGLVTEVAKSAYSKVVGHESVRKLVDAASVHTTKAKDQLALLNYSVVLDGLNTCVNKAQEQAAPYLKQYVYPLHEEYVEPVLKQAQPHIDTARTMGNDYVQKFHAEVTPTLKKHSATVYDRVSRSPEHLEKLQGHVDTGLGVVYDQVGTMVPQHRHLIPLTTLERIAVLLFAVIFVLNVTIIGWTLTKISVKLGSKTTSAVIRYGVLLPLRIVLWPVRVIFGLYIRTVTCCFCCGRCQKRKEEGTKKADNGKTQKGADTNGVKKGDTNGVKKGDATVDEVLSLLNGTKDKKSGKANADVVKQLAEAAKTSKPMHPKGYPKLDGKVVSKDILKKALAKFPDVDLKKLKL